jgi:hypothetical protein
MVADFLKPDGEDYRFVARSASLFRQAISAP